MKFLLDYYDKIESRRNHPKLFPKVESETAGGILEMNLERVIVEDI